MSDQDPKLSVTPFWAKVATALSGIVTMGFLLWAGVVWQGWQDVREMLFEVNSSVATIGVRLENVESKITDGSLRSFQHARRPWHDEAGNHLSTLRLEIDNLRALVEKVDSAQKR